MKRSRPAISPFSKSLAPLVLGVAIIVAGMVRADGGLPDPGFRITPDQIVSQVADARGVVVALKIITG